MWRVTVTWALCICVCAAKNCTVIGDDGATYEEEVLATGLKWGTEMALNLNTNKLYINYYNISLDDRVPGLLDLKDKTFRTTDGPRGYCGFTVDQLHQDIYCWCSNYGGLYKWDSNIGQFAVVAAKGETVYFAHYADGVLYYTTYVNSKYQAYTFTRGVTRAVPQFGDTQVTELVVDGAGAWVFRKEIGPSALYRMMPATSEEVLYAGNFSTVTLSVSAQGIVYTCDRGTSGAILRADDDSTLHKVVSASGCSSVIVDRHGNFMYYSWEDERIVRLNKC